MISRIKLLTSGICLSLLCFLSISATTAFAQDDLQALYVSDSFEVPVRQTGCNTCTIVHYGLPSGTMVFSLGETIEDWTRIRSQGGIEGWMPTRFLLEQPGASARLESAEENSARLTNDNLFLSQQLDGLLEELMAMGLSVETLEYEGEEGGEVIPVMTISGDVIGLNSQNEELIRRNQFLQQEIDILTARNDRLEDSSWRAWFVYGAAAVLAGAFLSLVLPKLLPRRKYSEWG